MSEQPTLRCSTSGDELLGIGATLRSAADAALLERERLPRAVRLRFRVGEEAERTVADFVRRERECCPFFDSRSAKRTESSRWR